MRICWLFLSFLDFWTLGIFRLTFHGRQSPTPIQHLRFPKVQKSKKLRKSQKIINKKQKCFSFFDFFWLFLTIFWLFLSFLDFWTLGIFRLTFHGRQSPTLIQHLRFPKVQKSKKLRKSQTILKKSQKKSKKLKLFWIFLNMFWLFLSFLDFWTLKNLRCWIGVGLCRSWNVNRNMPKVQKSKKLRKS